METWLPIITVVAGIFALLFLVLRLKFHAFLALILVSIVIGLCVGLTPTEVIDSVQKGMGGTLAGIAVIVGLGAMFGALLEQAGGIDTISTKIITAFGEKRAPYALGLVGFLVAIPVFFDVAFIILVPVIHRLSRATGKSLLTYALPLLAGLAVTHAFIPPTPGPIAVAAYVGANLGWVIMLGFVAGIPAMIMGGPFLVRFYKNTPVSAEPNSVETREATIQFRSALWAVLLPLFLILAATATNMTIPKALDGAPIGEVSALKQTILFIGSPITALIISVLWAYVMFGVRRKIPREELQTIMGKALEPAGVIILITGAGGVLKQMLKDSGVGEQIGQMLSDQGLPILLIAFLIAYLVRIAQGSATVAMVTAGGLVAAALGAGHTLSDPQLALLVIAIASGATMTSHVNDSGFWLVNRYLGQSEAETLRSWTVASTVIGLVGFGMACLMWIIFT